MLRPIYDQVTGHSNWSTVWRPNCWYPGTFCRKSYYKRVFCWLDFQSWFFQLISFHFKVVCTVRVRSNLQNIPRILIEKLNKILTNSCVRTFHWIFCQWAAADLWDNLWNIPGIFCTFDPGLGLNSVHSNFFKQHTLFEYIYNFKYVKHRFQPANLSKFRFLVTRRCSFSKTKSKFQQERRISIAKKISIYINNFSVQQSHMLRLFENTLPAAWPRSCISKQKQKLHWKPYLLIYKIHDPIYKKRQR